MADGRSVSGRSVFLDTALALDDSVVENALKLPRNTLSAAPAHRRSRGLPAVFVSFDRKVQAALRRLCFERMTLEARLRAETDRLNSIEQNLIREPDVMNKIRTAIADNEYNIRRLAGDATPQIIAALHDPQIRENLQLAIPSEEDTTTEQEARLWRRNLDRISIPVRVDQPYRYASHDSPTVRGHRDLHNDLNKRTGEEGLSYYQKQQLKYGKGRRGSTSIAGAWEQVFADGQGGQEQQGIAMGGSMGMGTGMGGYGSSAASMGGSGLMGRADDLPASSSPPSHYGYSTAGSSIGMGMGMGMGEPQGMAQQLQPQASGPTPQDLLAASLAMLAQHQAQAQARMMAPQPPAAPAQLHMSMPAAAPAARSPPTSPGRQVLGYTTANIAVPGVTGSATSAAPLPGTGAAMVASQSAAGLEPRLQDLLSRAKAMLSAQMP